MVKMSNKKEISVEDATDSGDVIFGKAAGMRKKNKNIRNSTVTCLLHAIAVKQASGVINLKKEQKLFNSLRHLQTLSPQANNFVSANCRL